MQELPSDLSRLSDLDKTEDSGCMWLNEKTTALGEFPGKLAQVFELPQISRSRNGVARPPDQMCMLEREIYHSRK